MCHGMRRHLSSKCHGVSMSSTIEDMKSYEVTQSYVICAYTDDVSSRQIKLQYYYDMK